MRKVVIISGGGGGIGRSTAKIFSDNNYYCVIVDIDEERALKTIEILNESNNHTYFITDISNPKNINSLVESVMK